MSISLDDIEMLTNMLFHQSLTMVQQSMNALLNYFQGSNLENRDAIAILLRKRHPHNLVELLSLPSHGSIADKLLALFINLAATGEDFIISGIFELDYLPVLIEILEKEGVLSTVAPDSRSKPPTREANRNRIHLLLLLLSNLTNTDSDAAVHSLVKLHADRGVTEGFYLRSLLRYFQSTDQCLVTAKCLLYIILNLSRRQETCATIITDGSFLRFVHSQLQQRHLSDEQFGILLKIVRNMALNQWNTQDAHRLLIDSSIADEIIQCFHECVDQTDAEICANLTETIYFLCASADGISWMEGINGKRLLEDALKAEGHPIGSGNCQRARGLLEKLVPVLDDIQDVYVSTDQSTGE